MPDQEPAADRLDIQPMDVRTRHQVAWLPAVAVIFVIVGQWARNGGHVRFTWPFFVWLPASLLIAATMIVTARRTARGLTLSVEGITWHLYELFLPWSAVAAVELGGALDGAARGTKKDEIRLVVKVKEPALALDGYKPLTRRSFERNIERFGGPVAISTAALAVDGQDVVAAADRLKKAYVEAGGFATFADSPIYRENERALRTMRVWGMIGFWSLAVVVMTYLSDRT